MTFFRHKNPFFLFLTVAALAATSLLASCSKDNEPDDSWKDSELCHKLVGTSWQLTSVVFYWNDGTEADRHDETGRSEIYTFTDQKSDTPDVINRLCPYVFKIYDPDSDKTETTEWWLTETNTCIHAEHMFFSNAKVVAISPSELQLRYDYDNPELYKCDYGIAYYKVVKGTGDSEEIDDDNPGNPSDKNDDNNNDDPTDNPDKGDPILPSVDKHPSELIGTWSRGSFMRGTLEEYHFLEDGNGYYEESQNGDVYRNRRIGFTWEATNNTIHIAYKKTTRWHSESMDYEYSISGKTMNFKIKDSDSTKEYTHDNTTGTTNVNYNEPFAKNYLLDLGTGWCYSISSMKSGCTHAKHSGESNEKFIHFFGADDYLTTAGMRIHYNTPYYEGIDGIWSENSYIMSDPKPTYWIYNCEYWLNGTAYGGEKGDKLTIKKSGKITTYDYNGKDVKLHVSTESKY